MFCDFDNPQQTCPACGYVANTMPLSRVCRPVPKKRWKPIMVGDLVEKALTSVGITKERVERLTRTDGKPGGCGCKQRQRWMNEAGVKVQLSAIEAAKAAKQFYFGVDNQ